MDGNKSSTYFTELQIHQRVRAVMVQMEMRCVCVCVFVRENLADRWDAVSQECVHDDDSHHRRTVWTVVAPGFLDCSVDRFIIEVCDLFIYLFFFFSLFCLLRDGKCQGVSVARLLRGFAAHKQQVCWRYSSWCLVTGSHFKNIRRKLNEMRVKLIN